MNLKYEEFDDTTPEELAAAIAEVEDTLVNDQGTEPISDEEVPVEEEDA